MKGLLCVYDNFSSGSSQPKMSMIFLKRSIHYQLMQWGGLGELFRKNNKILLTWALKYG